MLPDLRIVIAAVLSTFVLTAGVGFYASSRLIQEPKRTDSLAAMEETPVNRIALSWPAPTRQADQPALDFAVTAKALRNPVRDVPNDPAPGWPSPHQSAAIDADRSDAATPASLPVASIKAEPLAPSTPIATAPTPPPPVADPAPTPSARTATLRAPIQQPDIRVAVQYPPIADLPPELKAPVPAPVVVIPSSAPPPEVAAPGQPPQDPVTTGSVVEKPATAEAEADPARPGASPDVKLASRPEPESVSAEKEKSEAETKPAAKPARKKAAKKAAPKAKRPVRVIRRQTVAPAATFPFNFFGTNLSN